MKELRTIIIEPIDTYSDHKVAIVAAYHSKYHSKLQLDKFILHMNKFMNDTNLEYKIFIMEDNDSKLDINIGKLFNAGYELANRENFDQIIFHNIHLLPNKNLLLYYKQKIKEKTINSILHSLKS